MRFSVNGIGLLISKYVDLLTAVKFVPQLMAVLMSMNVRNVSADGEFINDSADGLKDIVVGAEEVIGWRLGIDNTMNVLYDTVVVDWDLEWRWVGFSVIRKVAKEFRIHVSPASSAAASGRFEYGSKYLAVGGRYPPPFTFVFTSFREIDITNE